MPKYETPDPTPMELPVGFEKPESLEDLIRRLVKSEAFIEMANNHEIDTFEESEDFEIDDESFDPKSPYEEVFDPVLGRGITPEEFEKNHEVYEKRYREAYSKAYQEMLKSNALRAIPRKRAEQSGPKDGEKAVVKSDKSDGS